MGIEFLTNYSVPIVIGVCLCVGYVIKNLVQSSAINRYIPLIVSILGVAVNVWLNLAFTPEVLLGGLFSGLISTGMHQLLKNIINRED
jgi:hypothetical protein